MADQASTPSEGIDVLPLSVGSGTYAVKLSRVATVLRTGVLDDVDAGDVIELTDHTVALDAAADLLGETAVDETAVVVFHGTDDDGHVPGWLVGDVGDPTTVSSVAPTVGAMRAVRGTVPLADGTAVLLDPFRMRHP